MPEFTVDESDSSRVRITTEKLNLEYLCNSGTFKKGNVKVDLVDKVNGTTVQWDGSTSYAGNLFGTIRTLDGQRGEVNLGTVQLDYCLVSMLV